MGGSGLVTAPTAKARKLRNAMTEPEVWLWGRLKRLHAQGYHFRRQRPFRDYVLDFVCFDRRLVVELDGGHHSQRAQAEHDGLRDAILTREGFRVMRFWNSEVRTNIDGVMHSIMEALESSQAVRPKTGDPIR